MFTTTYINNATRETYKLGGEIERGETALSQAWKSLQLAAECAGWNWHDVRVLNARDLRKIGRGTKVVINNHKYRNVPGVVMSDKTEEISGLQFYKVKMRSGFVDRFEDCEFEVIR